MVLLELPGVAYTEWAKGESNVSQQMDITNKPPNHPTKQAILVG